MVLNILNYRIALDTEILKDNEIPNDLKEAIKTIVKYGEKVEGTKGQKIEIPESGLTLIEAFAEAGGLTESSKSYKIKLLRGNNKNPEVFNFNFRDLQEFKKANIMLEANDIVYVDSKPRYARKIAREISPYITLMALFTMILTLFN